MTNFTESVVEEAALDWLEALGYEVLHVQAADRSDLRKKLSVASGGVVFTTIQKFFPEEQGDRQPVLTTRSNVVVIADEAHRSQYDFIDGFARHMHDALPQCRSTTRAGWRSWS